MTDQDHRHQPERLDRMERVVGSSVLRIKLTQVEASIFSLLGDCCSGRKLVDEYVAALKLFARASVEG